MFLLSLDGGVVAREANTNSKRRNTVHNMSIVVIVISAWLLWVSFVSFLYFTYFSNLLHWACIINVTFCLFVCLFWKTAGCILRELQRQVRKLSDFLADLVASGPGGLPKFSLLVFSTAAVLVQDLSPLPCCNTLLPVLPNPEFVPQPSFSPATNKCDLPSVRIWSCHWHSKPPVVLYPWLIVLKANICMFSMWQAPL